MSESMNRVSSAASETAAFVEGLESPCPAQSQPLYNAAHQQTCKAHPNGETQGHNLSI